MKAYHLTESAMPQSVAIIFGRFNPPHKGHKHAWVTAAENADEWFVGTNKSTIGPEDPLPFEVKIEAMTAIMPEVADHLVAEQSWWTLAAHVFKKYGGVPGRTLPMDLVVITDEPYVVPGLTKSNGVPGPHGEYSFQNIRLPFENIDQARKYLRISSATSLRNAVAAGDREAFTKAAGVSADAEVAGHKFFDLVAHYLMPHREAHAAKEKAKAEKAAAKQAADQAKAQKAAEKAAKAKGPAQELAESGICWKGYKRKPGTKKYAPGSCEKIKESHKRLSEELEAVYENRHGSIQTDVADALPAAFVIPKLQNQDAYSQYRFGLAVAAARGQKARKEEHGEQFSGVSPWGQNEIVVTFDPSEISTVDSALSLVGLNAGDKRAVNNKDSIETKDVSKRSPVANIKRNKYGI